MVIRLARAYRCSNTTLTDSIASPMHALPEELSRLPPLLLVAGGDEARTSPTPLETLSLSLVCISTPLCEHPVLSLTMIVVHACGA